MKRFCVVSSALLLTLALAVWGAKTIHADPGFSNGSFSGSYVFHFSGSGGHSFIGLFVNSEEVQIPIPTPFSGMGELLADGDGNIVSGSSGTIINEEMNQPITVVDHSCDMTFTGTYTVNHDGTGTMTLIPNGPCDLSGGAPINFQIRITGKGNEGVFISRSPGSPGGFSTIMSGSFARK